MDSKLFRLLVFLPNVDAVINIAKNSKSLFILNTQRKITIRSWRRRTKLNWCKWRYRREDSEGEIQMDEEMELCWIWERGFDRIRIKSYATEIFSIGSSMLETIHSMGKLENTIQFMVRHIIFMKIENYEFWFWQNIISTGHCNDSYLTDPYLLYNLCYAFYIG